MEFLFELSDNVVKSSRYDFRRYLFSQIPIDQRLVIIKGARGTGNPDGLQRSRIFMIISRN